MRPSASPLAVWAGILVLYVVWGSTYLGMKLAMDTITPFVMGALRFITAGLLITRGIALVHRRTSRRRTLACVRDATIIGTGLLLGGTQHVTWGARPTSAGTCSRCARATRAPGRGSGSICTQASACPNRGRPTRPPTASIPSPHRTC